MNLGVNTVFLILGRGCNLNCKYCLQHDVIDQQLSTEIKYDVLDYIISIANNNNHRTILQFYGGEPLVYFNNIKKIVEYIESKTDKIAFSTISNGKFLTEEMVNFINEHFCNIAISYDGRNSSITRGYDIFNENRDNLLALNNLTLSGVLSTYTYPKDLLDDFTEVNKEYYKIHNTNLRTNIDELLDVNLQNPELKDFDYTKIITQIQEICNQYENYVFNNKELNMFYLQWIQHKINNIKYGINNLEIDYLRCDNGFSTMNMDLQGNIYQCHNTETQLGTINTPFIQLIKTAAKLDPTKNNNERCNNCEIQLICRNGCALVKEQAREDYYCKQQVAINLPIINMLTKMGDQ